MDTFNIKFEDFPEGLMTWIDSVTNETNCKISKTEWRNKFDDKICYTHRPENPEEYEISITITADSKHNIDFISYLVENKLKTINYLRNCLTE